MFPLYLYFFLQRLRPGQ